MADAPDNKRVLNVVLIVGAIAESATAIFTFVGSLAAGKNIWAIGIGAFAIIFFFLVALSVYRPESDRKKTIRGGYLVLTAALAGHVVLTIYLTQQSNKEVASWLLAIEALWLSVVVLNVAIVVRLQRRDPNQHLPWQQALAIAGVSFTGAMVVGLSATAVGIGIRQLRLGDSPTGQTLVVESVFGAALGLALLLGRGKVVSLFLLPMAPVLCGFAIAAVLNGDATLGDWLLVVGAAALGLAILIWFGRSLYVGWAFVICGFIAGFCSLASFQQPSVSLGLGWIGLMLGLLLTGIMLVIRPNAAEIFRVENDYRAWGVRRYLWSALGSLLSFIGLVSWSGSLAAAHRLGASMAAYGCAAGALSVFVAIGVAVLVYARSPRGRAERLWGYDSFEYRDIRGAGVAGPVSLTIVAGAPPAQARKWWTGEIARLANALDADPASLISPTDVAEVVGLVQSGQLNDRLARQVIGRVVADQGRPAEIISKDRLKVVADRDELLAAIDTAFTTHPEVITKIRNRKTRAIDVVIGEVMKAMSGSADAVRVRELVLERVRGL